MTTEKLKRKSMLAAASFVDSATAGALLAVDRLHGDWHTPVFVVRTSSDALEKARALLPACLSERVVSARCVGPIPSLEYEVNMEGMHEVTLETIGLASEHRAEVAASTLDASRDTLLREPYASQLRSDLDWSAAVSSRAGAAPGRIEVKSRIHEGDLHEPIRCGTFQNLPSVGPSWPQCECLRFNPPGATTCARCGATPPKPRRRKMPLQPRRWKRGQKRTDKDRRRARQSKGVTNHDTLQCGRPHVCGTEGDECPKCHRPGETLHAEDVPRVGERARERALRAKFGGGW